MNQEEQIKLLEQTIECFEQEIKLKDELIREQKKSTACPRRAYPETDRPVKQDITTIAERISLCITVSLNISPIFNTL